MNKERRLFERVETRITANCSRYQERGGSFEHLFSCTRDISARGARLIVPREVRVGEQVLLHLDLPTCLIGVLAGCEVAWVRRKNISLDEKKEKEVIETGVSFLNMDRGDSEKLKNFLGEVRKKDMTVVDSVPV
ncbi:MAG: PilZ domain-containing protein [Candidatus Omnitrophota bacterium]